MPNFALLADELTVDPLSRGYAGMTDAEAQADISSFYRDGPADPGALFNYLTQETAKDDSTEPVASAILGRIYRVIAAGSAGIGTEVFVGNETPGPFKNLQAEGLDACHALRDLALGDRLGSFAQFTTDAKLVTLLDWVKDTGVMKPSDVTAIQALSQNKQRRDHEIGFGSATVAHITRVRAA